MLGATIRAAILSFLLVCAGFAFAHSGASGIVKQRMEAMKDVAANMKVIAAVLKGEAAFDAGRIQTAARTIAQHGARIPSLFPEGSGDAPSEALPEIWADWTAFTALAGELTANAETLERVAETVPDAEGLRAAFAALAKNCKTCHATFRLEK